MSRLLAHLIFNKIINLVHLHFWNLKLSFLNVFSIDILWLVFKFKTIQVILKRSESVLHAITLVGFDLSNSSIHLRYSLFLFDRIFIMHILKVLVTKVISYPLRVQSGRCFQLIYSLYNPYLSLGVLLSRLLHILFMMALYLSNIVDRQLYHELLFGAFSVGKRLDICLNLVFYHFSFISVPEVLGLLYGSNQRRD